MIEFLILVITFIGGVALGCGVKHCLCHYASRTCDCHDTTVCCDGCACVHK